MLAVAPAGVIIHNPEFARWAVSDKGDAAVIDGAKALALTALELMGDAATMNTVRDDFEATADLSKLALARVSEKPPHHDHAHGGCGCA